MTRSWSALSAALLLTWAPLASAADPTVTLKKGDRIIFLGDSITESGAKGPTGYVNLIKTSLADRHKDLDLEIIGAGVSGNKVPDLQARVDKDVVEKKPTLVVIYIGINDVWHGEKDPSKGTPKDKFEAGLREVIGKITRSGAQVVLCTPSVIGEQKGGTNKLDSKLDEYADISRKIAKDLRLPLIDLRKTFVDYLKANNPANKADSVLTTDGVHLNDFGNQIVADVMLKTLDP
jgi:lysophospholipase L1-like esterase